MKRRLDGSWRRELFPVSGALGQIGKGDDLVRCAAHDIGWGLATIRQIFLHSPYEGLSYKVIQNLQGATF